jgi:Domain of unknown function (DUF1877)
MSKRCARFDPDAMAAADIYPNVQAADSDAFDSYLAPHFAELCRFYRRAAASGHVALLARS